MKDTIKTIDHKKTSVEDGITSKILLWNVESLPQTLTSIYNGCLKNACFPKRWKKARIIPIIKPGKEEILNPSKFRPISLLNVGGKVLEKLLINRINHYLYTNTLLNDNQYGFRPQRSTTDAAIALKEFIYEAFQNGQITVIVSLDVKGAFDSAWWPSVLKALKDFKCPRNLYYLTKS